MKLRYKYRLFPNKTQEEILKQYGGSCRYIYNYFLNKNIELYDKEKKFIFYNDMSKQLTLLKRDKDHLWLNSSSAQILQQKLRNLDRSIQDVFKYGKGFPKFKKKNDYEDSFCFNQNIKIDNGKILIPKIGYIKYDNHREMPSDFKSVTIKQHGDKWYISFLVEKQEQHRCSQNKSIGIDLGIKSFLHTSEDTSINNPRFLDKKLKQLKRAQKRLSRKKLGSNNKIKQILRVRRIHNKIKNQRHNFLHQLSNQITNDFDIITIENLAVKNMMRNRKLSKAISQVGWGMFKDMLIYKSILKSKYLYKVDRFYPSSKTCSNCGHVHKKLSLDIRTLVCESCEFIIDRDLNAAINIDRKGNEMHKEYTVGITGISIGYKPVGTLVEFSKTKIINEVSSLIAEAWTLKQELQY